MYTINQVNDFTFQQFMDSFSNIIELCPKFALVLSEKKPFQSTNDIILILYEYLENLETEEKQAILTRHPDLSGKLEENLTEQSVEEQKSAELNIISDEERNILLNLNSRYRRKFGFPFVICARQNNYKQIINMFEQRLQFEKDEEINNGIGEVQKIATLRILDLICDDIKDE